MKYYVDCHTHTIASGHAYTTFLENAKQASEVGIKVLGTTDHGPHMPGACHEIYFANLKVLPREIYGVTILKGCEANIIDYEGNLDLSERFQERMEIIIASLHDLCIKPGNRAENTRAFLKAMDNPNVDIIGHPGNPVFPIWEEEVVKRAKEKNVLIELNNSSFGATRAGSEGNCKKIAMLCKENNVKVIIGSDAHTCFTIGRFEKIHELLTEIGMPEELIINTDSVKILKHLKNKGKLKDINLD